MTTSTSARDWVVVLELDEGTPDDDRVDVLMDAFSSLEVSVGTSLAGRAELTLSLASATLAGAAATALALIAQYLPSGTARGLQVRSRADHQSRAEWVEVPDLVSLTQAAQMLGVSRQRVDQMIREGALPAIYAGTTRVLPAATVQAMVTMYERGASVLGGRGEPPTEFPHTYTDQDGHRYPAAIIDQHPTAGYIFITYVDESGARITEQVESGQLEGDEVEDGAAAASSRP